MILNKKVPQDNSIKLFVNNNNNGNNNNSGSGNCARNSSEKPLVPQSLSMPISYSTGASDTGANSTYC
jgi:hypothetical protein